MELVVAGSNPVGHPTFISAHTECDLTFEFGSSGGDWNLRGANQAAHAVQGAPMVLRSQNCARFGARHQT